ncbi:cupin domain-containing protein [Phytohalomonas tamaricis]|uniref:cupin domain-containing protein n=1 Tax=Phytohalomonas tamaricis TaxID=2081032 RepID=UPI000D0B9170|nr:cupin domain-containing protein [Phytohalomonas tamaricis]
MSTPLTLLGGLSAEQFLADYWQKRPLLIRGAFPDFESPLSPDELAGLACEENVEARLVEEHGSKGPWQLSHGPFDDDTFSRLGDRDWTLLVQAVDHYVPDVAELLEHFDFIPSWRLDDIMVSYAPPGGNVGPHVDNYDVFLLQASGQRRWQVGGLIDEDAPIISGIDLRILESFEVDAEQDWVLEPGDMLYLPPRIAHHGVSQSDDCMTFSVGFRAPSADEIVTSFADYMGEQLSETLRYNDADLKSGDHAGKLEAAAIERVRALLLKTLDDRAQLAQWFGRYMTQAKYPDQLVEAEEPVHADEVEAALKDGIVLERTLGSRFAFHEDEHGVTLFVDGDGVSCEARLARHLASTAPIDESVLRFLDASVLLAALLTRGSLSWPGDDEE